MSINIAYSSEMMSQYIQGETIGPGHQFEALQTADGHSLLFSIGTNGVFYLIEEQPELATGWQQNDLSTILQADFSSPLQAKNFSVAQLPNSSEFGLLLVITVDEVDYLYYSNTYSRNSEDNSISLEWTALPFDAGTAPAALNIAHVYYANTNDQPVGVVDLAGEQNDDILRYYIDPQKKAASNYWTPYLLPYDMNASEAIYLCDGRRDGAKINGLYTLGTVGNQSIVVFQEFFDYYGSGAAPSTRLLLPSNVAAQNLASIASVAVNANKDGSFTDLFVTGADGGLYYFAANQQADEQEGILLFQNDLFKEIQLLQAYKTSDKVVVWGLNRAQQVFYTQVSLAAITTGSAWSLPLAIASQVEQISPYVNRVNGGNTYFAHTGTGELKKAFQDPVTTLWTKQDIVVPALPDSVAQKFDAYTTKIALSDENNIPLTDVSLQVSSSCRTTVYINYHYYVLDTTPIEVPVDSQGSLYILQRTESLQASLLTIASLDGSQRITVNPMDKVAEQYFSLNTTEALQDATVTDDKGENPQPLIPDTASDDDLQATADAMQSLSDAYSGLDSSSSATISAKETTQFRVVESIGQTMDDFADAVVVAAGDLVDCLVTATDYVIHIVKDAAEDVWNFVCEIGDAVLTFVIDTIEKVIAALQAILQALATLVELAIQFVKFLFSWGDIQLTKDVFKNILLVTAQGALNAIDSVEEALDEGLKKLNEQLNDWANIPNTTDTTSLASLSSQTDNSSMSSASSDFLQYYLVNNADAATMTEGTPPTLTTEQQQQFDALVNQINAATNDPAQETSPLQDALQTFYNQFLAENQYQTMPLSQLIEQGLVIFGEILLGLADEIFDALLDFLKSVASSVITLLNTPIWIPVLSNILEEFFDTSIGFSVVDVLTLVAAVPATLGYKILTGKAPFEEGSTITTTLCTVDDFETLLAFISGNSLTSKKTLVLATSTNDSASEVQEDIFIIGRAITGSLSIIGGFINVLAEEADNVKSLTFLNIVLNLTTVGINATVNLAAQPAPLKSDWANALYKVLLLIHLLEKEFYLAAFSIAEGDKAVLKGVKIANEIATLTIKGVNLLTTLVHIIELIEDHSDYPVQANLALMECGVDISDFIAKVCDLILNFIPKEMPTTTLVVAGIDVIAYCIEGGLQLGQTVYAAIEE